MASSHARVVFLPEVSGAQPRAPVATWEVEEGPGAQLQAHRAVCVCVFMCECVHVCGAAGACMFTPVEGPVQICTCVGSAQAAMDPRRPQTSSLSLSTPPLQTGG